VGGFFVLDMKNPRESGRAAIVNSVPPAIWQKNLEFSREIQRMIDDHPLKSHPIKALLMQATLNVEISRYMHLEFAYAFAQIFTDSLIHAMATSAQLEPQIGPLGKVSARFLLQLNLLDELGYAPNPEGGEDYYGNPLNSHYIQFVDTLKALDATPDVLKTFRPSVAAQKSRKTFTDYFQDHMLLTLVLAAAETLFSEFASPWAESVKKSTNIDTSRGYHKIHVENDGHFVDDDHSEDSWFLFRQAIVPARYEEAKKHVAQWLDTWNEFGNALMLEIQEKMDQ
jgi:hypothetical protein